MEKELSSKLQKLENKLPVRLVGLTDIQKRYLRDRKHKYFVVTAGRRSRKTLLSRRKILEHAVDPCNRDHRYFHAAPTRDQAYYIFWNKLLRDYRLYIKRKDESKRFISLYNGTEIHVVGLDKPQRLEGSPWNGGHVTEMADVKEKALDDNILPGLADTDGFLLIDGVPEGMNHYHDIALYAAGGVLPPTLPGVGAFAENSDLWCYYSWRSIDVLGETVVNRLSGKLDEKTALQEFGGEFVSMKGLAYYAFGDGNIQRVSYDKSRVVHIGMDFNVNPMTATLCHVDDSSGLVEQFGELYLEHSNTPEMIEAIHDYFNIWGVDPRIKRDDFRIYPDSTGRAHRSNAAESDIELLKGAGFGVYAPSVNPRVKDRISAVNSKICAGREKKRSLIVDPSCKRTIRDMQQVERLADGRENKKQEEDGLVHISSALGYLISYKFPFRKSRVSLK